MPWSSVLPTTLPQPRSAHRQPQLVTARLDRVVEVEPADARLDHRVAELLVDLEHAVHPAQVDDDRAADARRRAAVAVVLADPRDPERHAVLVGDPDDRLDLLDASPAGRPRQPRSRPSPCARRDPGTRPCPRRQGGRARLRRLPRRQQALSRCPARRRWAEEAATRETSMSDGDLRQRSIGHSGPHLGRSRPGASLPHGAKSGRGRWCPRPPGPSTWAGLPGPSIRDV